MPVINPGYEYINCSFTCDWGVRESGEGVERRECEDGGGERSTGKV